MCSQVFRKHMIMSWVNTSKVDLYSDIVQNEQQVHYIDPRRKMVKFKLYTIIRVTSII